MTIHNWGFMNTFSNRAILIEQCNKNWYFIELSLYKNSVNVFDEIIMDIQQSSTQLIFNGDYKLFNDNFS